MSALSIRENLGIGARLRLAAKVAGNILTGGGTSTAGEMVQKMLPMSAPPRRGTTEYLRFIKENPLLRMCVYRIADGLASQRFRLVAPTRTSAVRSVQALRNVGDVVQRSAMVSDLVLEGEAREITEHPALDIWSRNMGAFLPGYSLRKLTHGHLELTGEGFWFLGRNAQGVPVDALSIPPSWIIETPRADRPTFILSKRFLNQEIPAEDILWFKDPDVEDPYLRGVGPATAIGAELETMDNASEFLRRFFHNDMRPNLLIYGSDFKKTERQKMELLWRQKVRGVANSHGAFFMQAPESITIKEVSSGMRDHQMTELMDWEVTFVRKYFGIPPSVLGDFSDNSGLGASGVEIEAMIFARWCLVPRLELFRAVLQEWVELEYDDRLVVVYDNPIQEDKEFQLKVMKANPVVYNNDEWRAFAGHGMMRSKRAGEAHIISSSLDVRPNLDPEDFSDAPPPVEPPIEPEE